MYNNEYLSCIDFCNNNTIFQDESSNAESSNKDSDDDDDGDKVNNDYNDYTEDDDDSPIFQNNISHKKDNKIK